MSDILAKLKEKLEIHWGQCDGGIDISQVLLWIDELENESTKEIEEALPEVRDLFLERVKKSGNIQEKIEIVSEQISEVSLQLMRAILQKHPKFRELFTHND